MQLEVEPARVANGLPLVVPPPQRGGVGVAVGARKARATIAALK